MPSALEQTIAARIAANGPLRFDEFMELALYSDPHGYYRRHVPGADSDYRTSPTLTPWFGRLVARWLEQVRAELGSPDDFTVVEAGGGSGDLALTAMETLGEPVRWVLVEPLPQIRKLQKERLGGRAEWVCGLSEVGPVTGVIVANEVFDNFPVRQFELGEQGLMEVNVGVAGDGFVEVMEPCDESFPAVEHLEPGDRFELASGFEEWFRAAAGALERGSVLAIDYGDTEPPIWTRRPTGTLVTYGEGQLGVDLLSSPGEVDITAHVNFTALSRAAARAGLSPCPIVTQREWLRELGLTQVVENLRQAEAIAQWEGRHGDWVGLMAERSKVETLAARGGLGDYLVFNSWK